MKRPLALTLAVGFGLMGFAAAADGAADWPKEIAADGYTITVYEPQPDALEGNFLDVRAAVMIQKGGEPPTFGAFAARARIDVDRDARIVHVLDAEVDNVRFPDMDDASAARLSALVEAQVPKWDLTMSLDSIVASLEAAQRGRPDELKNDPPRIRFATRPTILVPLDGPPVLRAIPDTELQRVVNTPIPLVFDPAARTYWLYGSSIWFSTRNLAGGEWSTGKPPRAVRSLFDGVPDAKPVGETLEPEALARARILVATEPTELIVSDGEPRYAPLVQDRLLYMTSTDSDVFLLVESQQHYVVLSGRWYRSGALDGAWTWVPPADLPEVFAQIPPASAKSQVLAHVPGTEDAQDAVIDALIPQTAAVQRGASAVSVQYDGEPRFEPIPGTELAYAVNTASQVIRDVDGRYFLCEQGVWYSSRRPNGPWEVSEARPSEIDDVPASSPVYNTKYVYVYDTTPEAVYVGYTPGYLGCYPYYGTIVYGTGWPYDPWVSPYYYYPRPLTWGFHMHYSPWTGWGYGMSWSMGWASISWGWGWGWGAWHHGYHHGWHSGYWAGYNTGYWAGAHPGGWFGPGGYRPHPAHYGGAAVTRPPATSPSARTSATVRPANLYASRDNPNRAAIRPARAVAPTFSSGSKRPATTPAARPTAKPAARPPARPNDVFAGRDGNVYRYDKGQWQQRQGGAWKARPSPGAPASQPAAPSARPAPRPAPRPSQPTARPAPRPTRPTAVSRGGASLDSAQAARQRAATRTQQSRQAAPQGGRPSGSRGSGGGGGRRR